MTNETSPAIGASPDSRRFAKAKSIAASLDMHPKTIARWGNAGLITPHKVNSRVVLFDIEEVTAFITRTKVA